VIFHAHVEVRPLEGIANPEGQAIERALPALGYDKVSGVQVGKVISFRIEAPDETTAGALARELCDRLLANPVIEEASVAVRAVGP
jgi:phosphoribosylformylglycinamidine synthase PurS subunit